MKTTLGDKCNIYNGNSINADYKKKHFAGLQKGFPYIATKDVSIIGTIDYDNGVRIPFDTDYKKAYKGSVFICAEGGSAGKKMARVNETVCFGNKLICIQPKDNKIDPDFLYYYLMSNSFKKQFRDCLSGLIGGVSISKFKSFEIEVPIIEQQHTIVQKLNTAFGKIDTIKLNVQNAFYQARELFQRQLADILVNNENWEHTTLKDVSIISGNYGISAPSKPYTGVRYLRITDITEWGDLNKDKVSAQITDDSDQKPLIEGDILFARTGATVGKTLIYRKEYGECLFAGYLIRYRLDMSKLLPRFLYYITHSALYYKWVRDTQKVAAQPNINAKLYDSLPLCFPKDLKEQQRLIDILDHYFFVIQQLKKNFFGITKQCEEFKASLLKQCFE